VRRGIQERGGRGIIVATGTSKIEFLDALTGVDNIDWQRVEMFHLDEYVGLPITHQPVFAVPFGAAIHKRE